MKARTGWLVMTRGASGVVGVIHHAWTSAQQPSPPWVVVSGTRGRLTFELGAPWLRLVKDPRRKRRGF